MSHSAPTAAQRSQLETREPLIVGIDWADSKHDLTIFDGQGRARHLTVDAEPQDVEQMIDRLQRIAGGRTIAVCLEKGRVRIIYHLMLRENFVLYPVDPKQVTRYRESFVSSCAKDDRGDSYYLARLLDERRGQLMAMRPDDPLTRKIAQLCHVRRNLVNDKTSVIQRLHSTLKMYHPLVFLLPTSRLDSGLCLEFIRRWADPRKAQKLHRLTIEKLCRRHGIRNDQQIEEVIHLIRQTPIVSRDAALIEPLAIQARTLVEQLKRLEQGIAECEQQLASAMAKHPDAKLFTALPGAGSALAPRLLVAYGSDRERYSSADKLACYLGIAPVTRQSGKSRQVMRRRACPKFLLQTFHEFAGCAIRFCPWSGAFYRWQRSKGVAHHAALRKLATRWNRILYRVWQTREPYNPERYLGSLRAKNHPLLTFLTCS